MEFVLDPHSPLPTHSQIQEQVKLALLLGRLRPGDTLPSIRDVEKEIHVSRSIVRKAYLALQRSGILTLRHGKGVLVEKHLSYSQRGDIMEQCQALSHDILSKAERMGISPSAFARYPWSGWVMSSHPLFSCRRIMDYFRKVAMASISTSSSGSASA